MIYRVRKQAASKIRSSMRNQFLDMELRRKIDRC